ncbi:MULTISPECIES: ATP-dependent zinc metalloprotease FtsH [Clostridia]|jgi:cell division protease FtsH|uniref:ATP-dependent zinc metalloprotease FtsH n=1 Tax=Clostridia TaxID=186801 RepID=UPI000E539EA4|nr:MULTISPECIES: ATP-dependent zinc metalloprotease FtsH [Clostridia]RGH41908.1 ATP-dependent metallopeptidase FtsH/Yme1/Tma family protein [Firmicutes bacterium AM41-5BH]RHV03573.1 ATP-dependent metallopeptidase FtsH/Yme1/Tma family protein [Firmicutes bacterium OM07-11]RKQ31812.1 ATP-dependent zinc metalloprotease FtsH [Ruminococcus sp. B05]TAP36051.1 ATP-dependent metallopeptidase FtsH/Yme1/Tma family protein [Mediterraneibacter sp. gm002]
MDNQNNNNKPRNNRQGWSVIIITTLLAIFVVMGLYSLMQDKNPQEISYYKFLKMVDDGKVDKVKISSSRIYITLKEGVSVKEELDDDTTQSSTDSATNENSTLQEAQNLADDLAKQLGVSESDMENTKEPDYYTGIVNDDSLPERLYNAGVDYEQEIPDTMSSIIFEMFVTVILPIVLLMILFNFLMKRMTKGGGMMGIGKSNAKVYVEKETGVTFQDVAGEDEAKESLQEVVDFLHNPGKYTGIGAKLPKGALLVGPPGTGKTLLAKAVAGEAKVPFFSLSGSAFVEMYVGVGASRVRDLFKQAQQMAPCIVFIDEIDAIGKSRDTAMGGGNDEREQTLNQLLAEMDGFDTNKGLLLLAATNRPEVLDPALLRPGRFDRRIIVDKPDLKGRVEILKVHSKDVKMDETVDLEAIALATSGAVGSDLANMINEAAINAVKHGRQVVSQKDLFEAVEVVLVGKEKKDRIMSNEERRIVSYHEVGHALVSALQKDAEPVQKITIVPRTMGALGYVMQTPEEEKFLNTKKELEAMLVGALAGRAAEEIVFETVTTGASNDIEQATKIARAMITQYGMSEKFGLIGLESVQHRYLDGRAVMNCGEATAAEIDKEVMEMLKKAYAEAKSLLTENREALDKIAAFLIEKETITGKEFMKIFREVKGIPEPEESQDKKEDRIVMKQTENAEADNTDVTEDVEAENPDVTEE